MTSTRIVRFGRGRHMIGLAVVAVVAAAAATMVVTPAGAAVSKWSSVSAGAFHTCGIKTNRTLWCWGLNNAGQLGVGDNTSRSTPTQVGTATNWATVVAGDTKTCGLTTDGTRYCWGTNGNGALGLGDFTDRWVPTNVPNEGAWASVSVLSSHGCGIRPNGAAQCWGDNSIFQFGNGNRTSNPSPTDVAAGRTWNVIRTSYNFTCGIDTNGERWCWGSDDGNQLGLAGLVGTFAAVPTSLPNDGAWTALTLNIAEGCGLSAKKRLYCWGFEPTSVTSFTWKQVGVSGGSQCGIRSTGTRYCKGKNNFGQLGLGHTTDQESMTFLEGDGSYLSISMGRSQGCGISTTNRLYCWGENKHGEIGDGTTTQRNLPVLVS